MSIFTMFIHCFSYRRRQLYAHDNQFAMVLFRLHKTPNKLGDCGGNKFNISELLCERCQLNDNLIKVVKIFFQFRNLHWSCIMIWCEKSPWIFTSLCSSIKLEDFIFHLMHFIEKVAKISICPFNFVYTHA